MTVSEPMLISGLRFVWNCFGRMAGLSRRKLFRAARGGWVDCALCAMPRGAGIGGGPRVGAFSGAGLVVGLPVRVCCGR